MLSRLVPIVGRTRRRNKNRLVPIFPPPVFPFFKILGGWRRIRMHGWVFHHFRKRGEHETVAPVSPREPISASLLRRLVLVLRKLAYSHDRRHARVKVFLSILTDSI